MSRSEYLNQYTKDHYDRINLAIPKGYKERIKAKADELGVGLSEYIFTLICNDLEGVSKEIKEQKQGFSDEDKALLDKWQVRPLYYDMIANVSLAKGDYYIQLKPGYINDVTQSRELHAKTSHEMRILITKSHQLGKTIRKQMIKPEPAAEWLTDEDIDRLEKWQVPRKYYPAIKSIEGVNGTYTLILTDDYINDTTGENRVEFKTVSELRQIMKYTHKR